MFLEKKKPETVSSNSQLVLAMKPRTSQSVHQLKKQGTTDQSLKHNE